MVTRAMTAGHIGLVLRQQSCSGGGPVRSARLAVPATGALTRPCGALKGLDSTGDAVSLPRRLARRIIPFGMRSTLLRMPTALRLRGKTYRCPCCGWGFKRLEYFNVRPNAKCPRCWSQERHRLLALYLQKRTSVLDQPTDVLHIAPEDGLRRVLKRSKGVRAVAVDLDSPLTDLKMDLRDLSFPDDSFDVAICSHVLEHIQEDRQAMAELYRVLRPGGFALVLVPYLENEATTREDPTVVDPAQRERLFGQSDHVRFYGRDLVDRLEGAGFEVKVERFGETLPAETMRRYALNRDPIFRCTKPLSAGAGS